MMWLRHLIAIATLPFMVAVVIPVWIARRTHLEVTGPASTGEAAMLVAGVVLGLLGLVLFGSCLRRFASEGHGTLAPWDPPRTLVVRGAYRYVRNPMISGVVCVLVAETLILRSRPFFTWALVFTAINAVYIPLMEEPLLEARFGEPYREYCRHVRRLVPRLQPWDTDQPDPRP